MPYLYLEGKKLLTIVKDAIKYLITINMLLNFFAKKKCKHIAETWFRRLNPLLQKNIYPKSTANIVFDGKTLNVIPLKTKGGKKKNGHDSCRLSSLIFDFKPGLCVTEAAQKKELGYQSQPLNDKTSSTATFVTLDKLLNFCPSFNKDSYVLWK